VAQPAGGSARRQNILAQAWATMDAAGVGSIEPGLMVATFKAEAHPWVVEGQVTADQVTENLLNDCEVGAEVDGKVTFGEFARYFEGAYPPSSCDDVEFGTIVSSLFGAEEPFLPQPMSLKSQLVGGAPSPSYPAEASNGNGQGAAAMPPPAPSLASTGITGGVYSRGAAAARENVHKQQLKKGASYSTLDLSFDGTNVDAMTGKPMTNVTPPLGRAQLNAVASNRRGRAGGVMTSFVSTAAEGVMPGTVDKTARIGRTRSRSPPGRRAGNAPRTVTTATETASGALDMGDVPAGLQPIIAQLKGELKRRGAVGIIGLSRRFRAADDDGSKTLNIAEFTKAMTEMGFRLSNKDMHLVFNHFDVDGGGTIDFEEFIQGVRDPLTDRRKALVAQAFAKIDVDNNGFCDPQEIMQIYDASKHPDVVAGKRTPEDVLREFLETFEVGGEIDGKVTKQEFLNYYTNIGANIPDDDYFELMIRNAWHISGGEGWCANSANRRVLVTHADGKQTVEEIKDDLGIKADDKNAMIRALAKQGVRAADISTFDGAGDVDLAPGKKRIAPKPESVVHPAGGRTRGNVAPVHGFRLHDTAEEPSQLGFSNHARESQASPPPPAPPAVGGQRKPASILTKPSRNVGLQNLVARFKAQLAARGVRGIHTLGKKFALMCDPGSKVLTLGAFKVACAESGLVFESKDLTSLFRVLDDDDSGFIDFDEFLHFMRGPMNERRMSFVEQAFGKLDRDGNGVVEPHEVATLYDASMHPDVVSGKRSAEDVLAEFLETFEYGGDHDGKVTANEFAKYYANVSASIDDDDYFELMMRNAWHISGGEGWCANTSNTRVLVTHADGKQTVEEIKDDLGVKRTDSKTMLEHLKAQGDVKEMENVSLSVGWSNDNDDMKPPKLGKKQFSGFGMKGVNNISFGEPPSEEAQDPLNYGDGTFRRQFKGRGQSRDRSADFKSSFKIADKDEPEATAPVEKEW
jgi:Ca2+-binding EF-hand superfamily protein